ncbi:MAG: preprotein translocase subunit YajC [Candidatus Poribacteria bacterium]|nr:preprotein translocase subunit YajC [Candidatus Poribacteria bacterium]
MEMFFMFIPMLAILYFLIWRPEQLKRKKHQAMLDNLAKGNLVVTTGGLHGKVIGVDKEIVVLAIAENVKVEVSRGCIAFLKKGGELIEGE